MMIPSLRICNCDMRHVSKLLVPINLVSLSDAGAGCL